MKRFKKILKITGITIGVLLILLITAPFLFKGKIVQAIKNTANRQLNATLDFDNNISLSFLRNFPNVSLGINKLSVVGKDSFAGDTLVYLPELRLTLDIMSAIKGDEIKIKRVYLKQPEINLETLPSGRANWDIVKTDTTHKEADTTGGKFKMALQLLEIEKGHVIYNDRSLGFYTELKDVDHTSKGDFTSDNFLLETKTETPSLVLGYGGINWLYHIKTHVDADLQMDMNAMKFSFAKGKATLNDLNVESEGFVDLNDEDIDMDIKFKALENSFRSFLSLVPGMYQNNFKDLQANGTLSFNGFIKGKMTDEKMPAMDVALKINNGSFRYPSLPYPADNIFLDLHYYNPDGIPNNSVVDISRLNLVLAGDTFNLKMLLKTPISDPFIDGGVKGKLDLSKIAGLIPLEKGTKLAGLIDADLYAKGSYSIVSSKNYERLDAKGKLAIKDLIYQSPTDKYPYKIDDLNLDFTPQKVNMPVCKGTIGKNDFDAQGSLENMLGYAFAGEVLKGDVKLKSHYLNVNSFMSDSPTPEEPKASDTGALSIVELPSNIDMNFGADIDKLIYDNYVLTNLGGNVHLHNAQLDLQNVHSNLLGGTVALNGIYDSKNVKNPFTSMDTKMEKLNLAQSFDYFPMLSKFAPIAKFVDGMINADIDMSSILNEKMQPNYNSMNVNGMVSFTDAAVRNLDVVKQIASQLKVNWLNDLQLKNQALKFQIKDGIFKLLDSLTLPLGQGATMRLAGITKLDQTIHYGGWIKVPRKAMGSANAVLDGWLQQASGKGWNLNAQDMIPVDLAVTGTILKPQVNVSLKGFAKSVKENITEQGKQIGRTEANKRIGQGLEKAQAQADKIKAEAKDKADKLREEGKRNADAIRSETKTRANQLRDEGDKAYQQIIDETNKQADALVNTATNPLDKQAKKLAADRMRKEGAKKAQDAKAALYQKAQDMEDEGNKRADQVESESNKKADDIEKTAQEKADKVMQEAEAKGKL